jgi:parvulin-like peptidyl-prolyl isomerase
VRGKLLYVLWGVVALTVGVTLWIILGASGSQIADPAPLGQCVAGPPQNPVAIVGNYALYDTDIAMIRADDGAVDAWVYDQILACAAEKAGLENPSVSRFVANRARQLYLRDLMMERIVSTVDPPSESEILVLMYSDPGIYMVERHYFQIIAADSILADSIHSRLNLGQNFQVTARNISLGQKAGIGGDLGFATGAEMLVQGLPEEIARLDGLSPVIPSSLGWHIFNVSETRALEDTVRAFESAGQLIYQARIEAAIDSVVSAAQEELSVEVMR